MMQRLVVQKARSLRKNSTKEERKLWLVLHDRKKYPQNFRRQHPIHLYIVDFCSRSLKLIIELDGSQHLTNKQKLYDLERTVYLNNKGFYVIRFWNGQINQNISDVVDVIDMTIKQLTQLHLPR